MAAFAQVFKYVWPQMRKFRGVFYFILVFFSLRIAVDRIVLPFYFKKIIDLLSDTADVGRALISNETLRLVFIVIGINFLIWVMARVTKFFFLWFEISVVRELRNYSFQKIEQNSHTFFTNTFAGSLVTKTRRFTNSFETVFDVFMYNFLKFVVVLIGVFAVLMWQVPVMSAILVVWIVIHLTIVYFLVARKVQYDLSEAAQDSRISGRLADVFSNILAVKFFSARKREIVAFAEYANEGFRRSKISAFMGGKLDLIQHLFVTIVLSVMLYVSVIFWLQGKISTGTVVLINTYMVIIADILWEFGNSITRFMKSIADMKEMTDIFEVIPDIEDPKKPEEISMREGHVIFKDVFFSYAMGGEVLHNFNLDTKPGERVGIVGHSGAGKSTITKLLLRFNDIKSGLITIDEQDIRSVRQDDLRSRISYVPQEPVLFHRSIRENISYGKPEATEEEIINVAKQAHAHEFIEKLPYGYDTLVGERGVKLSGGERQRVAIARAMLKDVPVLVLDEATSSLDSVSESYIQDAFNELMKGKTTIVIAHRLSTIQKMDRIVVLDKGEIVEEGTHKELLAKGGIYADLWEHQTGGFLE